MSPKINNNSTAKGAKKKKATVLKVQSAAGKAKSKKDTGGTRRVMPGRSVKRQRRVLHPVLPCERLKRIAKRDDRSELERHFKEIELHRQKFQDRIDAMAAAQAGTSGSYTGTGTPASVPGWKAKVTEARGEEAATDYVIAQEKGYLLSSGFAAGTGFDQVYYNQAEDTFLIVEAKGFGAKLSTNAAKGEQMSTEWVTNTLTETISSPTKSVAEKADAAKMLKGIQVGPPPKVRGMVIMESRDGGAETLTCPDGGKYTTGL